MLRATPSVLVKFWPGGEMKFGGSYKCTTKALVVQLARQLLIERGANRWHWTRPNEQDAKNSTSENLARETGFAIASIRWRSCARAFAVHRQTTLAALISRGRGAAVCHQRKPNQVPCEPSPQWPNYVPFGKGILCNACVRHKSHF